MPTRIDLKAVIGLPPEQALAYFRSKGYAITWRWEDLWQEAQATSFTVAKAMRLDILQTIRDALEQSLTEGTTLRDFQRDLEPQLKALGWWGKQVIVDAAGNADLVQLGSPYRLATIFNTNTQVALMAGRYRGFMDNIAARPFWQYVAVMDSRTRPSHAALHGRVFRYDDPFWSYFYPPNGFRCRCRVRALSQRDVEARGLVVSVSGDALGSRDAVDHSTGLIAPVATYKGPGMRRAVSPDMGWSYNPAVQMFHVKPERYDSDLNAAAGNG